MMFITVCHKHNIGTPMLNFNWSADDHKMKTNGTILISSTILLRTLSFPCLEDHASHPFHKY